MSSNTSWIYVVGSVVTIIAVLTAALAYATVNWSKSKRDYVREQNADLTARIETLEAQAVESHAKITALVAENATLREMVTHRAAVDKLTEAVASQHAEVIARLSEVIETFHAHLKLEHPR